ncbi:hypothetical protein [Microcoleus sp. B7-D4]|uniref:hypothetical protein n=1 Tax=Microcoleus sp. B7-D4 TaxID=2818696 RepID=UPI002FD6135B
MPTNNSRNFHFFDPSFYSQQSTVNSQQSTVNSQQSRTVQPESISLLDAALPFTRGNRRGFAPRKRTCVEALPP